MTILGLIVVVVLMCLMVYVASRLPAPWGYALYVVIFICCLLIILNVAGVIGTGSLNTRIR